MSQRSSASIGRSGSPAPVTTSPVATSPTGRDDGPEALAAAPGPPLDPLGPGLPSDELIDGDAIAAFRERYDDPVLDPLVVVIPAYNEEDSIGRVLASIPSEVFGHRVSTLVVVDGATDGTAEVVAGHGALVCVPAVNRGQGAALRLGYRVAVGHGARWIVVIDADGQYDAGEMATLMEPLLEDRADVVLGSRRLGRADIDDRFRYAGVLLFSAVISRLTGCRVTDSSSGYKAMTAAVAAAVRLTEPQYQAAEFLISAIGRGFRVAERPVTMRRRTQGTTKKAPDLLYGCYYARAIVRTWLRER
ncbi:MAG: glycosyltransferase family 2 protein [Acidimicrobiales bacterium]